jgi:hypothetical protein
MDTLEKAKTALHKATIARLNEIEGLVKVALETENEREFTYCIAQINNNSKIAVENAITINHQHFDNMTDETLAAIKEGVDIKMYEMGYGLLEMSDIIRNLHREYMELD